MILSTCTKCGHLFYSPDKEICKPCNGTAGVKVLKSVPEQPLDKLRMEFKESGWKHKTIST